MRGVINLFNRFWDKRSRDIIIGCIGRIESFDNKRMRADVQPFLEYTASGESSATKFAVIGDIPVQFLFAGGYYIRPDYVKGDLVWVTYATFSIEHGLSNTFDNTSGSIFSRENASVANSIAAENWNAPAAFSDPGLFIGHKDGTFIHVKPDEIKLKDKNGNEIKMNGDGVSVNNGALTVSI